MNEKDLLAREFESHRAHLRSVAYRMLGSLAEADDAVQEAWLRYSRTDTREVENIAAWLTTVVSRLCLDTLRSRRSRREDLIGSGSGSGAGAPRGGDGGTPADYVPMPDPIISREDDVDPERQALLADSVGLALLVVLETLPPAERLALVLHDMFGMSFDEIAPIVGRSSAAARKLASRARHRVQGSTPAPDADRGRQREVVEAFYAASRRGDFEALVSLLDPDVVLRNDAGPTAAGSHVIRGAETVGRHAFMFREGARWVRPALVNGQVGAVVTPHGQLVAVMAFVVVDGRIVAIDALSDPDRLAAIDLTVLDDQGV
jgi:RNA polymerase sigma factor (sigma-70 family)